MLRAAWNCGFQIARTGYGAVGFALAAAGALKDVANVEMIPFPAWVWWLGAIALLFILAARLQWRIDQGDAPAMRRLKMQRYATFREISETIAASDSAWSKDDILRRLMMAMWRHEFESYSGHSRMRMTFYDDDGQPEPARPIVNADALATTISPSVERALFDATMRGTVGFAPGFVDSHVEPMTLERSDFSRWLRRFRACRYET